MEETLVAEPHSAFVPSLFTFTFIQPFNGHLGKTHNHKPRGPVEFWRHTVEGADKQTNVAIIFLSPACTISLFSTLLLNFIRRTVRMPSLRDARPGAAADVPKEV